MTTVILGAFGLSLVAGQGFDDLDVARSFVIISCVAWGIACTHLDNKQNRKRK